MSQVFKLYVDKLDVDVDVDVRFRRDAAKQCDLFENLTYLKVKKIAQLYQYLTHNTY